MKLMLKRLLNDLGIEQDRVRLEWISAAEGEKVKRVINEMAETLTKLGPLGLPRKFEQWDEEMDHFAEQIAAQESLAKGTLPGTKPQTVETAHA